MKLCVNCRHFALERETQSPEMGKCLKATPMSFVTGAPDMSRAVFAEHARRNFFSVDLKCGSEAVYFEDKDSVLTNIEGV